MSERIDGEAGAPQSAFSGVTRRMLEHLPLPGDHRELAVVEVTYPPGGTAPLHRHPVEGVIYIVEGVAESAYGDDQPRQYRAGETLQDRADVAHTLFRNLRPGPSAPLFDDLRDRARSLLHDGAVSMA